MTAPTDDSEPLAMIAISKALASLPTDDARRRVLSWAADKHGFPTAAPTTQTEVQADSEVKAAAFGTFADFFDAVGPASAREKALAAAYWKTRFEGDIQFVSQDLNRLLTDLGHKSSNITDALSASMQEKPALILQLRKSGSTRQARKTYKMSEAGIRWIESRLRGDLLE